MTAPSVAVALSVRNGSRFLGPQLESIAEQTTPPDLLVVFDDASTDGSAAIVREFATAVPFEVRALRRNTQPPRDVRSRIASSFEAALAQCLGCDFVALSDHDDVWHPDHLRVGVEALDQRPDALLAFTNAVLVDSSGRSTRQQLFDYRPVPRGLADASPREQLRLVLSHPCVTGATAVMRTHLVRQAAPTPPYWLHDRWLSVVAAALGGLLPIGQATIDYRVHRGQQVGLSSAGDNLRARSRRQVNRLQRPRAALAMARSLHRRLPWSLALTGTCRSPGWSSAVTC